MNETSSTTHKLSIDRISSLVIYVVAFFMPIFFLPITTEFFEFNKLLMLGVATLLLVVLWAIKLILGERAEVVRSSLDVAILSFGTVVVLASIFAVNKTTSIFGVQGRWFPSLFGILILIAFYYVSTPYLKTVKVIKGVLTSFIMGATVSSLVAVLSYLRIFVGTEQYMRTITFTLTGSITTAVVIAAISVILGIALFTYEFNASRKLFLTVSTAVNLFYVALIGIPVGWVVLGTGVVGILVFVDLDKLIQARSQTMALAGVLAAIVLVTVLPTTSELIKNDNYPTEVNLPLNASWIVATSTVQSYPFLATGPSSFHLNFTRFRPLGLNNTNIWNVRFDKPANELLNILSTLGIIGIVIAIFGIYRILKLVVESRKINDETGLVQSVSAATLAAVAVYFVTYATVLNSFVLVLLLSSLVAAHALARTRSAETLVVSFAAAAAISSIGQEGSVKNEYVNYMIAAPLLILVAFAGFVYYKVYAGEYFMRKAIIAVRNNDGRATYEYQGKAINLNPQRDTYHTAYAQTNLALANAIAARADLTDNDRVTIQRLIAQSIRSARVATEVANPLNVSNWETRGLIYRSIMGIADNAAEWAIGSYNTALQLDPTNPALRLDLGGIYYANQNFLSAANFFRQSVALKPDYANAHYNFAQALFNLNDLANAKRELEVVKNLVPVNSNDYKQVEAELAVVNERLAQVAGAASNKPTVEEIENVVREEEEQAPQEPLTNVGEETQAIENENLDADALPEREPETTTGEEEQEPKQQPTEEQTPEGETQQP
jgi:tetratricopeptide (TPR) repeat protein